MEGYHILEIPDINQRLYVPHTLQQCDARQYVAMCGLLYRLENEEFSFEEFKRLAIYELLSLKKGTRKIETKKVTEAFENIEMLTGLLDSFFDISEDTTKLKLEYSKNQLEYIQPAAAKYYGPKDYFMDATFGEYEYALNVFMQYQENKQPDLLWRLLAIFYRIRKSNGAREDYNDLTLEVNKNLFQKLPFSYATAFYYTFASFHQYFTSSNVVHEGKAIDLSIIFTEQPEDDPESFESPYPSLGLKSIAYQLAESGVFGSLTQVRETPLWEVALRMYDIRKRDLDFKAKTKAEKKES